MKVMLIVVSMAISFTAFTGQTCTRNGNIVICDDGHGNRQTCVDNGPTTNCW